MIVEIFAKNTPLFIPFIIASHPNILRSFDVVMALDEAGVDIIN